MRNDIDNGTDLKQIKECLAHLGSHCIEWDPNNYVPRKEALYGPKNKRQNRFPVYQQVIKLIIMLVIASMIFSLASKYNWFLITMVMIPIVSSFMFVRSICRYRAVVSRCLKCGKVGNDLYVYRIRRGWDLHEMEHMAFHVDCLDEQDVNVLNLTGRFLKTSYRCLDCGGCLVYDNEHILHKCLKCEKKHLIKDKTVSPYSPHIINRTV